MKERKKKVSFYAPEAVIDRVFDLKNRKGLESASDAYNFVLKEYFRLIGEGVDAPASSQDNVFFKSVLEDLDHIKTNGGDLLKMLLIIGSQDKDTMEALAKRFPQYFKKS